MRVLFLFIGESHHVFHSLPLAAEMAVLSPETEIEVAIASDAHEPMIRQVQAVYPGFEPCIHKLRPSRFLSLFGRLGLRIGQSRLLSLLSNLSYFRSFDAIVVPERTTTIIRHLLPRRTRLIFTPHGAGDRAVTLDPRDALFAFVLVAGPKSERRLLDAGTIRPGFYTVNGYVKMDFMKRAAQGRAPLFANNRPTVLYAPHFRSALSSWEKFGTAIIRAFAAQDRYNLIVAPHIRLFHGTSSHVRAPFEALAIPDKIIIDLGSERLVDMSYTAGADIYLGDVSSQVYEFLSTPRPCVFLNAHGVEWEGEANYLFWTLGDVIDDVDTIIQSIDQSIERHSHYVERQKELLSASIGDDPTGAARRGAEAILNFLQKASE